MKRQWTWSSALVMTALAWGKTASAGEPETFQYTVKDGESCVSISAKFFGDGKRYDLLHEVNNLGPYPHHLKEGQIINIPVMRKGPDARLTFVRNQVRVAAPALRKGNPNDPLYRGNRVRTEDASAATVRFDDASKLYLGERTLVVILGDKKGQYSRSVRRRREAKLLNGSLRAHLDALAGKPGKPGKPAKPVTITTPSGKAELSAGRSKVHVDKSATTRLAVYKGRSKLSAQKKAVEVKAGFGSKAPKGKAPTPPKPLPPAPVWTTAPPKLLLALGGKGQLLASYGHGQGAGEKAVQWHVQLAKGASFEDIITDAVVPEKTTNLVAKNLPPGRYFTRVSGIDSDIFEGPFSALGTITVKPISVAATGGQKRLTSTDKDLRCGVNGASQTALPSDGLPLPSHGNVVVKCHLASKPEVAGQLRLAGPANTLREVSLSVSEVKAGKSEARVQVRDATGKLVADPGLQLSVDSPDGRVKLLSASPDPQRKGEWTAVLAIQPGAQPFRVRAKLPTGAAAVASSPETPRFPGRERQIFAGALVGTQWGGDTANAPLILGFEAGVNFPIGKKLTLSPSLRFSSERHGEEGNPAEEVARSAMGFSLPVQLGIEVDKSVMPYVGVAPAMVAGKSDLPPDGGSQEFLRPALSGQAGIILRGGPLRIRLEGGYRKVLTSGTPSSKGFEGARGMLGVGAAF